MTKHKGYYYTTAKAPDGGYVWRIRNKDGEVLQIADKPSATKKDAEIDAEEHINEYYY